MRRLWCHGSRPNALFAREIPRPSAQTTWQPGWLAESIGFEHQNQLVAIRNGFELEDQPDGATAEVRPASALSRDFLAKTGQLLEKYPSLVSSHAEKGPLGRTLRGCLTMRYYPRRWLAGVAGFEPGNGRIKVLNLAV